MSWKNFTCSSNCKDPENRKKKNCVCGGHNWKNPKRNLYHNSTKRKLDIKRERRIKQKNKLEYN